METKIVHEYEYHGLGVPVTLTQVEFVKLRGDWYPKVDVEQVAVKLFENLLHKTQTTFLQGEEIEFIRLHLNWSQTQFRQILKIASARWEKARLIALANQAGVSLNQYLVSLLIRQITTIYTVQKVPTAEVVQQARFNALLQQLGTASAEEIQAVLAEREVVPPEPELTPEIIHQFRKRWIEKIEGSKVIQFTSETQKQWQPEKSQTANSGPLSKVLATLQRVIKPSSIGFGEIALCAADGTSKYFVVDNLLEEIEDYKFNIPQVKAFYKEEPPYPIFLRMDENALRMQMCVGDQVYALEPTTEPGLFAVEDFTYFQLEEAFSETEESSGNPAPIVWLEEIN